ncbi:TetR/AcrR family transcriptional regulator [Neptuniibacter caesariensis]|uniref:Transcriptional regulator, TetR family protein n=1 Tax=Neptuniibacter caesariensis TaxID=207954 RepID=A0A7U8C8U7_NEPCE|nr:TetR/AcrR family transcriptional regulator [Neptuniibacter caesariensis]EAR62259.1 Transcriptional regulator, TetR family protein [Oceanospirillum sp. MED92] [Neptuniibacter caesariensis]
MARPAEFDRTDVLEKAMEVFWRTGYNATSITDLVNATKLKPGSLYGAFQSKRGLFLEVIDTYAERSINRAEVAFSNAASPLEGIERFFQLFCNDLSNDEIGRGCLMVNTMLELATEDDEIRERVSGYLNQVEDYFIKAITQAQSEGSLNSNQAPEDLATYLMTNIWGLRVLSSKRPDRKQYDAVITNILRSLHAPSH